MDPVLDSDHRLLELARHRRDILRHKPNIIFPWRRPCTVRTLLVTDGNLDFGLGDFGLATFVDILLNDQRHYVRFEITTAHLRNNVTDDQVMLGQPGIVRSIKGFVFDDPGHFAPDMYDEVWLFGIETTFDRSAYATRRADPARYPATQLGDDELLALNEHMNNKGGVFATGDHGQLGRALCGAVNRVRSMRYWDNFPPGASNDNNQVSMNGARRNDSNQIGHDAGSQFSDQSDDIPQRLQLKLYSSYVKVLREARYPHPVMCSRLGRIDVFPDHPHEGEVRDPDSLTDTFIDGSPEYPDATDGSGVVAPEVVASGLVPSGNRAIVDNAPTKTATVAHQFGVVSVYDGHRADVGRVVCDSTWHHFVNVNLIGVVEGAGFDDFPGAPGGGTPGTHSSKHDGFLSSPAGLAALAKIRDYYVNVGVWMAPPSRQTCFVLRSWWELLWVDRIVEATLDNPDRDPTDVPTVDLFHIGVHARGVLGEKIAACQTIHWWRPWLDELYPQLVLLIDPWLPWPPHRIELEPPLPLIDVQPIVDVGIGAALVALRKQFPYPPEEVDDDLARQIQGIALEAGAAGLRRGVEAAVGELQEASEVLSARIRSPRTDSLEE